MGTRRACKLSGEAWLIGKDMKVERNKPNTNSLNITYMWVWPEALVWIVPRCNESDPNPMDQSVDPSPMDHMNEWLT